jgi:beta-1,2-mannobiose phosphorylase / 1,2-beta-oligomannan phosphorylase
MVSVRREGVILKPTKNAFESKGVFNPGIIQHGNNIHMFYRAWDKKEQSTIGYAKLNGPLNVVERMNKPFMKGNKKKRCSLEDPRITKIEDTYYMTYTVYDCHSDIRMNYAISKDLKTWDHKGSLSPEISYDDAEKLFRSCRKKLKERYFLFESYFKDHGGKNVILWSKDHMLFPKKINGKFALLIRILPDIQIIYFKDFKNLTLNFWKRHLRNLSKHVLLESKHWYETRNVGGGCPPIETKEGWLMIYHAVDDMDQGKTYRAGAALLDKKNPQKIIGHHHEPIFSPEKVWEKKGNIPNVVFPTGTARFGNKLYIYYGAADKVVAVASVNIKTLVNEIISKSHKKR